MDNGFIARVDAIEPLLAFPVDRLARVKSTVMDRSQGESWDSPYFDLTRNRNRTVSPHWRGFGIGLGG